MPESRRFSATLSQRGAAHLVREHGDAVHRGRHERRVVVRARLRDDGDLQRRERRVLEQQHAQHALRHERLGLERCQPRLSVEHRRAAPTGLGGGRHRRAAALEDAVQPDAAAVEADGRRRHGEHEEHEEREVVVGVAAVRQHRQQRVEVGADVAQLEHDARRADQVGNRIYVSEIPVAEAEFGADFAAEQ